MGDTSVYRKNLNQQLKFYCWFKGRTAGCIVVRVSKTVGVRKYLIYQLADETYADGVSNTGWV